MLAIRRILFPTDFSEHADHAWNYALLFARQFGAEIHLLHVVIPPPRLAEAYAVNFEPERVAQKLTAEAAETLDRQVAVTEEAGLACRREVRVGVDAREILDYAATHEVDLIVMATHGRSGLAHVLLGSVAEKVVRKAPCPVVTIKPPAMKYPMP